MSTIDVTVPGVGEKSFKAASALVNFAKAAQAALADGWQAGRDLPAIYVAAAAELLPIAADMPALIAEAKDRDALVKAIGAVALLNVKV